MLIAAFIMGFIGSLHCAAMCGPLVLAMPVVGTTQRAYFASRLIYNSGRIAAYGLLGLFFGAIGKSLLLAGFQQWLSILAGVAMLAVLMLGRRGANVSAWRASVWIKSVFRTYLQRRSHGAVFSLGAANGLLPCGLVYVAGTASAATGDIIQSALYMIVFGVGTLPMMLGMGLFGTRLIHLLQPLRLKPLVPIAVSLVALSLILRGMALGIPYLSPTVANATV
ncbi:MAG: sulfite exporter TauE/SafE family protein, partial [Limisphaerales bacterium]